MVKVTPIENVIDSQRFTSIQARVATGCAAVLFCDAFSLQAVAVSGPRIRSDMMLGSAAMGLVFSAGLAGMMFGALLVGPLTERFGRKWPLVLLTLWFALCTIATIAARDAPTLAALRFLDGLGLGGAIPKALALTSEYSGSRLRRFTVSLAMVGYAAGGVAAGLAAGLVLEAGGWHMVFVLSGTLGLASAAMVALIVPESLTVLARDPARSGELRQILAVTALGIARDAVFSAAPGERRQSVTALFLPHRRGLTMSLWAVAFMAMLDIYLYLNWTPIFVAGAGVSLANAVRIALYYNLGAMAGVLAIGWWMDRRNPAFVLAGGLLVAALSLAGMAAAGTSPFLLILGSIGVGFGLGGGATGMSVLASTLYPDELRVTGIGWSLGFGRVGSVAGPLIGSLGTALSLRLLFVVAAVPALLAAVSALWLGRRIARGEHETYRAKGAPELGGPVADAGSRRR